MGGTSKNFLLRRTARSCRKEFGLKAEEPTLVYVSRMDESRALVARQLIAIAPKLAQAIPGLRMLIVGGGDVFEELLEESRKTNAQIGRECITMTGGRTDINELVAVADVFVGVSRAALEAMAAEKPVIVAGNEATSGCSGRISWSWRRKTTSAVADASFPTKICCIGMWCMRSMT